MKTKPCIFVFFLCELIIISVMAIKSSIDEKQYGATKEYKTKIEVDMDKYWGRGGGGGYRGEHDDVDMGGWLGRGTPRRRGKGGPEGGNEGGSGGSENKGPGGEGRGETKGPGGEGGGGGNKGGSEGSGKKGPGGRGGGGGPGGEGGGIKNGDHVEHP